MIEAIRDRRPDDARPIGTIDSSHYGDAITLLAAIARRHRIGRGGPQESNDYRPGNFGDDALVRSRGRLVAVVPRDQPTMCETTKLNERSARLYLNPGDEPRTADDLTALGVLLAEAILPADRWPPLDGDGPKYRRALASALGKTHWFRGAAHWFQTVALPRRNAALNRLVIELLMVDRDDTTAGEILKRRRGFVFDDDGRVTLPTIMQRLRPAAAWLIAVCGIGLIAWAYASRIASDNEQRIATLQSELDASDRLVQDVRRENETLTNANRRLENEVASLNTADRSPATPPPPQRIKNDFSADPFYLAAKNDTWFVGDRRFASLIKQSEITQVESEYLTDRIEAYRRAASRWRTIIGTVDDVSVVRTSIDATLDDDVRKILGVWFAAAFTPRSYDVSLSRLKIPDDEADTSLRIRLTNMDGDDVAVWKYDDENAFRPAGDVVRQIDWRLGQRLNLVVEKPSLVSLFLNWDNVLESEFSGATSAYRLSRSRVSKGPWAVTLKIDGLPGPPPPRRIAEAAGVNSPSLDRDGDRSDDNAAATETIDVVTELTNEIPF